MASYSTSARSSKSLDSSEFDDKPIIPPQPIARKEYKEEVPDISVVSVVGDNGSQFQNFQRTFFRLQNEYNFQYGNINQISHQEPSGIVSSVSKAVRDSSEKTNGILDPSVFPFKSCGSHEPCEINNLVTTSNRYNEQLSKCRAPTLLDMTNEQSNKQVKWKHEDEVIGSNKTCCKHADYSLTVGSNHKSDTCNHAQHLCTLNSNEPDISERTENRNCCCSKDQHSNFRKSLSKCERNKTKLLCPTCFTKTCNCNFLGRECSTNSLKNGYNSAQATEKFSENASHAFCNELSNVWGCLKRLEEKVNLIDEKVTNLSQHASCCTDQTPQANVLSNVTESDIPYILSILGVHSDKITELQEQINTLKSNESKSSPSENNKTDECIINQAQTISCVNIEKTCNEDIYSPSSHNVVCNEQTQKVTKTSTSTMTSFAIENDDKLVYRKQLTVVTDITREKKESSSIPKESDTPITKTNLNRKNGDSNSKKRKSHKHKCSPALKCQTNVSSNGSSDTLDKKDNQVLKTSNRSERKFKHDSIENKIVDKRHINDCDSDNEIEEQKNSFQKTGSSKSHSRSSKQKSRNSTSPKIIYKAAIKDTSSKNKKLILQSTSSSSSTDTECDSPRQMRKVSDKISLYSEEGSTTILRYGLSPEFLSVATKKYLDDHGLNNPDMNDRTRSSRKTSRSKRYM